MNHDHDTHTPSLDGPASLTFRQPSTPPEVPSFAEPEPIGTRHITITASTFDDSETMVLVDREDFPVWPAELEDSAACAAPAPLQGVTSGGDDREAPPDPVTLRGPLWCQRCGRALEGRRAGIRYCGGACRVAAHRARRGTPVLYAAERGR